MEPRMTERRVSLAMLFSFPFVPNPELGALMH
jgi:hypothetical protein